MTTTILNDNISTISEDKQNRISDLDAIVALEADKIRERSIEQKWTFGDWDAVIEQFSEPLDWEICEPYVPHREEALFDDDNIDGFGFWIELILTGEDGFYSAEVTKFIAGYEDDDVYVDYNEDEQEYMRKHLDAELYKFYN